MKHKVECPVCGDRLQFGSGRALETMTALQREIDQQRGTRPATRKRFLGGSRAAKPQPISDPHLDEGDVLVAWLHDYVHQIAHVTGAPPLDELKQQADDWCRGTTASVSELSA